MLVWIYTSRLTRMPNQSEIN